MENFIFCSVKAVNASFSIQIYISQKTIFTVIIEVLWVSL